MNAKTSVAHQEHFRACATISAHSSLITSYATVDISTSLLNNLDDLAPDLLVEVFPRGYHLAQISWEIPVHIWHTLWLLKFVVLAYGMHGVL